MSATNKDVDTDFCKVIKNNFQQIKNKATKVNINCNTYFFIDGTVIDGQKRNGNNEDAISTK